jgi:hypothetical protein
MFKSNIYQKIIHKLFITNIILIFVTKTNTMLDKYAPVRTKDCESQCDRKVLMTPDGPVIVCDGCNRIVMDNRGK